MTYSNLLSRITPRRLALLSALLALVPTLVVTLRSIGADWQPAGDWAVIQMRVADVGSDDTPLLGPYSRYGWNHLGPLMFWLLAVPFNLLGGQPWSLLVGAGLFNFVAMLGVLALCWRVGRLRLVCTMSLGLLVMQLTLGANLLANPWNPWLAHMPFVLLMVATWAVLAGYRPALPVVVLAASFLIQTHIGFGLMCAGLVLISGAAGYLRRFARSWWLLSAALGFIIWLPVLFDTIGGEHNLAAVLNHFGSGNDAIGLGPAVNAIGDTLNMAPALVAFVFITATLGLLIWSWRSEDMKAALVLASVSVVVILGLASVASITEQAHDWLVRWWVPLAITWLVAVVWLLIRRIPSGLGPEIAGASLLLASLVAAVAGVAMGAQDPPAGEYSPVIEAFERPSVELIGARSVAIQGEGSEAGWVRDGLALALENNDARFVSELTNRFGPARSRPPEVQLYVGTGSGIDRFSSDASLIEIARWEPQNNPQQPVPATIALFGPRE